MNNGNNSRTALGEARDQFVSQWGVIGSAWGVNRTMAQIHALLITAPAALSTDDIMEELKISRGNAHRDFQVDFGNSSKRFSRTDGSTGLTKW